MLARIDLRGSALPGPRELAGLLPRAATDIDSVMATVRPLCEDVRIRGAQAVREITARLDGVRPGGLRRPAGGARPRRCRACDPALRAALEESIARVRRVHADQRRTDVTTAGRARRHGHRALGAGAARGAVRARAGWRRCCPAW